MHAVDEAMSAPQAAHRRDGRPRGKPVACLSPVGRACKGWTNVENYLNQLAGDPLP
jgi:hypothetical protein